MDAADITMIGYTVVNWDHLLPCALRALGRSASAGLDQHGIDVKGIAPFAAITAEFGRESSNPRDSLKHEVNLRHCHLVCMVYAPKETIFQLSTSGLFVTFASDGRDAAIVSGDVASWKRTVADCLHPIIAGANPFLKRICCMAHVLLEQGLGFYGIFATHVKRDTPEDRMFFLTLKG